MFAACHRGAAVFENVLGGGGCFVVVLVRSVAVSIFSRSYCMSKPVLLMRLRRGAVRYFGAPTVPSSGFASATRAGLFCTDLATDQTLKVCPQAHG